MMDAPVVTTKKRHRSTSSKVDPKSTDGSTMVAVVVVDVDHHHPISNPIYHHYGTTTTDDHRRVTVTDTAACTNDTDTAAGTNNDDEDVDTTNICNNNNKNDIGSIHEPDPPQPPLDVLLLLQQFQQHAMDANHYYHHPNLELHTPVVVSKTKMTKRYPLRISVSNVAAICGYHPYKNLPELLLYQHVYQGSIGQLLLQHDAQLLDIDVVSTTQQLRDLANKVGTTEIMQMVETAIDIQRGTTKIQNIETATALTNDTTILQLAQQKLTSSEYTLLYQGVRDHVNTGYGIQWEDNALDLYEQQIGYKVEQRNDEICTWSFALSPPPPLSSTSSNTTTDTFTSSDNLRDTFSTTNRGDITTTTATVHPIRRKRYRRSPYASSSTPTAPSIPPNTDSDEAKEISSSETKVVVETTSLSDEKDKDDKEEDSESVEEVPFFSIVGSVDGIREEMAPVIRPLHHPQLHTTEKTYDDSHDDIDVDDEDWEVRQIIVECKHRMKRVCPVPPLYEQIQTSIYCLMYDVQYADIVQILRTRSTTPSTKSRPTATVDTTSAVTAMPNDTGEDDKTTNMSTTEGDTNLITLNETVKSNDNPPTAPTRNVVDVMKEPPLPNSSDCKVTITNETDFANNVISDNTSKKDNDHSRGNNNDPNVVIKVHRLDVDDPILQHRTHFYQTLLPRLQEFTQVVYDLRHNDHERYKLLFAVATPGHYDDNDSVNLNMNMNAATTTTKNNSNATAAWDIILQKCPWLQDCVDIAAVQRQR